MNRDDAERQHHAVASITLDPVTDIHLLAPRWQALARPDQSPFLTWAFISSVAQRFTAPFLLAVRQDEQDVALALLNRTPHRLHLHETGDPAHDSLFIEHNGLLLRRGAEIHLGSALRHLAAVAPVRLAGVDDTHLHAARAAGLITSHQSRLVPAIALSSFGGAYVDRLSANARAQLRRAERLCGADLAIARAADLKTALQWFDELVALHQASWQVRGKSGAFAAMSQRRFHIRLLEQAFPLGEADLLRITAGGRTIGMLYQLRQGGHVCAYQSGFVAVADAREKPGLVCHSLAIEFYRSEGAGIYDLLAGAARYKTTLAGPGGRMLHWFTLYPASSLSGRVRKVGEWAATHVRSLVASAAGQAKVRLH